MHQIFPVLDNLIVLIGKLGSLGFNQVCMVMAETTSYQMVKGLNSKGYGLSLEGLVRLVRFFWTGSFSVQSKKVIAIAGQPGAIDIPDCSAGEGHIRRGLIRNLRARLCPRKNEKYN